MVPRELNSQGSAKKSILSRAGYTGLVAHSFLPTLGPFFRSGTKQRHE